jgi:hypothetical protein
MRANDETLPPQSNVLECSTLNQAHLFTVTGSVLASFRLQQTLDWLTKKWG